MGSPATRSRPWGWSFVWGSQNRLSSFDFSSSTSAKFTQRAAPPLHQQAQPHCSGSPGAKANNKEINEKALQHQELQRLSSSGSCETQARNQRTQHPFHNPASTRIQQIYCSILPPGSHKGLAALSSPCSATALGNAPHPHYMWIATP